LVHMSMQEILEKYQDRSQESDISVRTKEQDTQCLRRELAKMEEKIRILDSTQRKMLGEGLTSCSMAELNKLESQAERGLSHIRARKTEILMDQIESLKRKELFLSEENAFLSKKYVDRQSMDGSVSTSPSIGLGSIDNIEVETQLVIRPPTAQDHFSVNNSY